ncbi:MAG: cytochrome bc complex cytochrome b subunit [Bacteroidales bacterium]|nr:cytochrome bc complex cytochrome b subunit [Bacteroidales bacterium]
MAGTEQSTGKERVGERLRNVSQNFVLHIHSPNVSTYALSPFTTMGLGVILICLFAIQLATGMLLMIHYTPSVDAAYFSVKEIIFYVPGGWIFRNIHRWSAHALVFITFLHMFRTFYKGSYYGTRKTNWVVGVIMLLIVMMMSFSGYLLPWDQLAYWAVTIGSNIAAAFREFTDLIGVTGYVDPGGFIRKMLLGGENVGQNTLTRFFTLHVIVLPVTLLGLIGYHIWRIRKDGGLARPASTPDSSLEEIPAWPTALWAEVAILLSVVGILLIVGVLADAPLKILANPNLPDNPAKSPWYLLGIQEIVSYSAFMGGFVIPLFFVAFLFYIPWFDREGEIHSGVWFSGKDGIRTTSLSVLAGGIITISFVALSLFIDLPGDKGSPQYIILSMILNPGTLSVMAYLFWTLFVYHSTSSRRMTVLALFTAFMTGWTIFMIIGLWFRGENWHFIL